MGDQNLIRLTPELYQKYWAYIPDSDILEGSDSYNYVRESAFLYYVKVKTELDKIIHDTERGP